MSAHRLRLRGRVDKLLIAHTAQYHLTRFAVSAVFAISPCSSLSCCSTSTPIATGTTLAYLRSHYLVRSNRPIYRAAPPPSSRQKYFPACSPGPTFLSSTRPPTLTEDEHADISIVHIWGLCVFSGTFMCILFCPPFHRQFYLNLI